MPQRAGNGLRRHQSLIVHQTEDTERWRLHYVLVSPI
jgi:hypothetical protein